MHNVIVTECSGPVENSIQRIHIKAVWNGAVIAESPDAVIVDGNHYSTDVGQCGTTPSPRSQVGGRKDSMGYGENVLALGRVMARSAKGA
jgi:hypothetical protein